MKLFCKETTFNGHRRIYFCGIRLISYKPKPSVKLYREMGVKIGENVQFIEPPNFGSEPFFIEIGDGCVISFNVTFLTHDGAAYICDSFSNKDFALYKFGRISIGNNVFIGCNSTIMPNVHIGDNCILGAGSVLTKDIPSGEVWAGNPAKFICKIEDYADKIISNHQSEEQTELRSIVKQTRGSILI